ncbi:phage virion morphogenesis protein [Rheinheimera marina]|uniref:Phage virion morphogenesis protein n=1 Tax=Rheinheimera marina TaxID=1774958 RepID=A0ABV9JIL4_9GAMM
MSAPQLVITPNKEQALSLKMQLTLLALPKNKRTRIFKTLGRYEKRLAVQRIRTQTDVSGAPFAERKKPKKGKKNRLLQRMAKTLEPFVKNGDRLELKHKSPAVGRVAALHQEGGNETMTAGHMVRIHRKSTNYDAPCSRGAAKALVAAGFKVRKAKSKRYRKATVNETQGLMNQDQASLILRKLRGKDPKQSWEIPVPARSFLGDSADNVQQQLLSIIEQINKGKRG